jgi:hypothetical protein
LPSRARQGAEDHRQEQDGQADDHDQVGDQRVLGFPRDVDVERLTSPVGGPTVIEVDLPYAW